jgi:hypothetical protein
MRVILLRPGVQLVSGAEHGARSARLPANRRTENATPAAVQAISTARSRSGSEAHMQSPGMGHADADAKSTPVRPSTATA